MATEAPRKRAKSVTFAPTPQEESPSFRNGAAAALGVLAVAGIYALHYHGHTNGLTDTFRDLIAADNFPGSTEPYRRVYTGIKPVDGYLAIFIPFFASVSDKSDDSTYLFWIWMIGQFGIQYAMLFLESLRAGNKGTSASYIGTAGTIFQNVGLAVAIPIFLLLNVLLSPISKKTGPRALMNPIKVPSLDLSILPFSILVGFFLPTALFMLPIPSINSTWSRQGLIAVWQFFPFYTVAFQTIFRTFWTAVGSNSKSKLVTDEAKTVAYLWKVRPLYIISMVVCVAIHLNVLAICFLPSEVLAQFPIIGIYKDVSFASVFIPPLPIPSFKISSLAEGTHIFLLWDMYVSSAAALVWAANLVRNADPSKFGITWWAKSAALAVVSGPTGALVMALWERDAKVVDSLVEDAMKKVKAK